MSAAVVLAQPAAAASRPEPGRFAVNLFTNLGTMAALMGVAAWYVPYLIHQLGPAAYGMVPLLSSVTSYMALITLALNSAVGRTLTIALEKQDLVAANRVFNTAFWSGLILVLVMIVPFSLGILFLDRILRVPAGLLVQVRWLAGFVAAAFLLNEIKTAFDVVTFSRNRFDLRNLISLSETLCRTGLVVTLFFGVGPALAYVGLGIFAGTVVSAMGALYYWRRLAPALRVSLSHFDWAALRGLTATGGWVVVNQLGAILYLQIDLLVANRLFGPYLAGRYAAVLQTALILRYIGGAASSVFVPTALVYYARHDHDGLVRYLRRAVKFIGLFVGLPIGLLCGFARPVLRLWLGPEFESLSPLLVLMSFHLCLNLAINPLLALQLSADRMRTPGLVTLVMGLGNLALAVGLARYAGWGLYGIAAAGAVMLTAKNLLFTPLYAARIVGRAWHTFLTQTAPAFVAMAIAALLAAGISRGVTTWTWPALAMATGLVSAGYFLAVWFLLLDGSERRAAINLMPAKARAWLEARLTRAEEVG
jgi:O-antigen/teichoic acid export membrane protein